MVCIYKYVCVVCFRMLYTMGQWMLYECALLVPMVVVHVLFWVQFGILHFWSFGTRGPLGLESTTEELLDRKIAAPV
jgi:hypothetical protein